MRLLTIVILISLVLIFGCSDLKNDKQINHSEVEKIESIPSFEDYKKNAKVAEQSFIINPKRDTLLKCRKGTQLYFPANSFNKEFENITIKVQEFYTLKDFISQNLTTLSDGRLLESGGMISVNSFANNQQIELAEGKEITISFPKTDNSKEMGLFYGQFDSLDRIDWIKQPKYEIDKDELTTETERDCRLMAGGYRTGYPGFYLHFDTLGVFYQIDLFFDKFYAKKFTLDQTICDNPTRDMNVFFSFNEDKRISNITFDSTAISDNCKNFISKFLNELPPINHTDTFRYFKKNHEMYSQHIKRSKTQRYSLTFNAGKFITPSKFKKKVSRSKKPIGIDELNNYIFQTSKLGWINCDRFINLAEKSKLDFIVNMNSNDSSRIYVILNNFNSLLELKGTDNQFIFKDAPINTDLKILAIKTENNKTEFSYKETSTDDRSIIINEFSDFDLNTIDEILN